jgi:hypothetical protein
MSRDEVAASLGAIARRQRRSEYSLEEDFFDSFGLCVSYNNLGRCAAVSLANGGSVEWEYEGYRLSSRPAQDVRQWALDLDPTLELKDGFISRVLGLSMWADWLDDEECNEEERVRPPAELLVFSPDYYEGERARLVRSGLVAG